MPSLPRPPGHHTITPGCMVPNAAQVIAFLEAAFGARVVDRYDMPGDLVAHAEVQLGDSVVMLGDPMMGMAPSPGMFTYYVDDAAAVDATYQRALAAGATSAGEPKNEFYGHRKASVRDPGGNRWTISAVIEEVPRAEMERRMAEVMKG